jgi:2-polyprenyl-3-methyl-5-hydroxy-6-metoxy-1,4-benzoquinol methylase
MPPDARYDAVAEFYVREVGEAVDAADTAAAALFELLGDVRDADVLDLACGQGRISRELARRGGRVTGLDLAGNLIESARAAERAVPLNVEYVVADAGSDGVLPPAAFDCVVCHFGLSDIDDLRATLRTVRLALRPGGKFVFSILHPCFPGRGSEIASSWQPGAGYHSEGWWRSTARHSRIRQAVGANHRTLSTYVNELIGSGLLIDRLAEPPPPHTWLGIGGSTELAPTFLVARCRPSPVRQPGQRPRS